VRRWELDADDAGGRRDPDAVGQGVAGREASAVGGHVASELEVDGGGDGGILRQGDRRWR